jgi:hypothetical protein
VDYTLKAAREEFGPISVAPLAIIAEKGDKLRTLLDASNRVQINHRIRVADREMTPSALDVQAAITTDLDMCLPIVALVVDVEKAHQQVPIDRRDWGHVAFSAEEMPSSPEGLDNWPIALKTVGSYGVSSVSWQWSRFASLFQRICYYTTGLGYLFRFADDLMALASNRRGVRFTRPLLRFLVICDILDVPLKWSKSRGGIRCTFVGYLFVWDKLLGGLADSRALWLSNWARTTAGAGVVVARDLRAALGRFSFSAVLLRYLLPFLGPFYAWVAAMEDSAAWPLPPALIILLQWIAGKVEASTLVPLRLTVPPRLNRFFKADAKAEGQEVCVGGYEIIGDATLDRCRWFAYKLNPENCPWAFVKQGQAYRVIASLELFATLLCVMFFTDPADSDTQAFLTLTGVSDNRGIKSLVQKHMTSKFPLYLILLELTEQLQLRRTALDLRWQPREFNQAADDLSNFVFKDFDVSLRLNPALDDLGWIVLPKLLREAMDLHNILTSRKALMKPVGRVPVTKKRKAEGLKTRDPW